MKALAGILKRKGLSTVLLAFCFVMPAQLSWSAGFTISGATVTLSNQSLLSVTGDLILNNGGLIANQSDIIVGGNWTTTGGTFNAGTSTVTFNGAAGQAVNNAGQSFSVVVDSNSSSAGLTFSSGFNAGRLTVNGAGLAAATTVYFQAGATFTIGKLSLVGGSSAQRVWMRSTTNTVPWFLNNTGSHTVSYVDVRDSDASSGQMILAFVGSVDSGNNPNWLLTLPAPGTPVFAAVYTSSIAVQWTAASPSGGYEADAATASDFSGTVHSSITTNGTLTRLTVDALDPNTVYYARAGNLLMDVTSYANTTPASTSTLASPLQDVLLYRVYASSIIMNWTAFGMGPGANTAQGYVLQASSTSFDGTGTIYFSSNTTPATSTLTITGLTPLTNYWVRAGAYNYDNVANFGALFSTQTANGAKTFVSSQNGNFNIGTTWGGACAAACTQGVDYPGSNDGFIVTNGITVTVTATPAQQVIDMTVNNGGTLTINGGFVLTSTGNYMNNGTISGGGALALTGSGTSLDGTGAQTLTGLTTLTNNKTVQPSASLTYSGAMTIAAATVITQNGTIDIAGTLTVTGTMNNNGTATTRGTLTGGGSWTQGTNAILNAGGGTTNAMAVTTVNFTANVNTVNYNASGAQTCKNAQYQNLTFSGTGAKTCTSMTSPVLGEVTMGGSAGWTLGAALTITGKFTVAGGTLTTGAFAFTASSTTELSGGVLSLTNNTGNKTLIGLVTVNGGTLNGAATTIILQGGLTRTSGSVAITGTATFNTNNQDLNGSLSITTLTVAGGITVTNYGTVTTAGVLTVTGALTNNAIVNANSTLTGAGVWTQGLDSILNASGATTNALAVTTVDFISSSNTVNYRLAGAQTCKNAQYYNLMFSGSGAKTCTTMTSPILGELIIGGSAGWTLGAALDITGKFTVAGGTLTTGAFAFTASSATELSGGVLSLTSNVGNKTLVGPVTVNGGTLNGAATTAIFQGGLTRTSGSVAYTGTATFNTNNQDLNGIMGITTLTVASGVTLTNYGTLTTAGVLTVTGSFANNAVVNANSTLTGGGSWTQGTDSILNASGATTNAMAVTTADFTSSSNTVNYRLAGAQTCKNAQYYNLTFSGSGAKTCTAMVSPILADFTLTGTASWTLGAGVTVNGNINLFTGTLDLSASHFPLTVGGNWTNIGALFTTRLSTVTFTGTSGQTIANAGYAFWVLIDSNTSAGGVTFASSFTATSLTINGAGLASATTVYFNADSTFTITTLNLQGSSGKRVQMRSTVDGTSWFLANTGRNTVAYVDVRDSDARGGVSVIANDGTSVDSGHNFFWSFLTGQVRTWWGTVDTNWSNWLNWDTGFPTAHDSVLIVSTATFMPVPTAAVTFSSLTIASGATLTTAGFNFTSNGEAVIAGTMTLTNAVGTKTFNGTVTVSNGGVLNTDTAATVFNTDVQVDAGGMLLVPSTTGSKTFNGILTLDGDMNVTANETVNINGNLVINGTLSGANDTTFLPVFAKVGGGGTISGSAGLTDFGSPTFSTTYTHSANLNLGTLTITGTTLTNVSTITVNTALNGTGGLTNAAGGFLNIVFSAAPAITTLTGTAPGNTINYSLGNAQTCRNMQYYNLMFSGSGAKTCTTMTSPVLGDVTIDGTAAWALGATLVVNGNLHMPGGTLTAGGFAFTVNGTTDLSGGTLSLANNTGAKTMIGLVTVNGGTLNGASTGIVFRGGITQTSGSVAITGTATLNTNNQALNGPLNITTLTVAGGITVTNNGTLTTAGTLTVTGGVTNNGTVNANSTLTGAGSWTQGPDSVLNASGGTTNAMGVTTVDFASSSNTVNYALAGAQTCKNAQYYNMMFSGSGAKTCTAMTSPVLGDFTLTGTAGWTLGAALRVNGNLNLFGGTFDLSASHFALTVGGDWTNTATLFTTRLSTVTFIGASGQTIDNAGQAFWVLIDSNTSAGGVTFASSFTATSLTINGAGLASATTAYFNADSTFTITTLNLQGASGKTVWLRSTVPGTSWFLTNTGRNSVTYVDVRDSDAHYGQMILANDGTSEDSGHNLNWNFGGVGLIKTWWGTVDTNWSNWLNWDSGYPGSQDSVLIVSTATFMPVPTAAVTISSLTIEGGGTLTTAGFNFTANGPAVVSGTMTLTNVTGSKTFNGTVRVTNGGFLNTDTATTVFNEDVQVDAGGTLQIPSTTGAKTFNGSLILDGDLNVTVNETLNLNGNLILNGTVSGVSSATFLPVFAKVGGGGTISGTAGPTSFGSPTFNTTYTHSANLSLGTLTITATTLTNVSTLTVITALNGTGALTNAAGALLNIGFSAAPAITTLTSTAIGNTVNYNMANAQTCRNTQYYNLIFSGSGAKTCTAMVSPVLGDATLDGTAAWTLGAALVVNGDLHVTGGTLTTGAFAFTVNGLTDAAAGTVALPVGAGNKTFVGLVSVNGATLNGASPNVIFQGGITQTGGSVALTGTATFNTNDQDLNGTLGITTLTVASAITVTNYGILTTAGTLTVTGSLTNNGTVTANSTLTGGGSWTQGANSILNASGGTTNAMAVTTVDFASSSNTVNYALAGAQTCKNAQYTNLTFSGSGAKTCTAMTSPVLGDVTLTGAASWTLGAAVTVNGDLNLLAGTLDLSASNYPLTVGGDWTNIAALFTTRLSTVTFKGASGQTIDNAGQAFWVLIDSNTSAGGVTFASSFTATSLTINSAALGDPTTVYFNAGSTFTVTTLNLIGSITDGIWIRPVPANQAWHLRNTGTNHVTYVDVAYSSASAGNTIAGTFSSTDSGHNTNWTFGVISISLSPSAYDFGTVAMGITTISVTAATTITNTGDALETYTLSVATTGATVWGVAVATPTITNRFMLTGVFNSTQPPLLGFTSTDVITSTPTASTSNIYAGDQNGVSVTPGATRKLWMALFMPPNTSTENQQTMDLTVSASTP